ncbi:MAG TPA: secretin N-terminal domain-containing protein, partial [Candidatus Omnitrophota bacterium]|nr:secretin N-terminal domain-containing protein [Candidatus Omnitrophota bacterium]
RDIKGKVNVTLKDVTIDEALDAILGVNGYAYSRKGNIIYVTPGPGIEGMDMKTEIFQLKYLNAQEASTLLEKVISTKGDIRINQAMNSLVVTDFPSFIEKLRKAIEEVDVAPLQVLIESKLVDITEKDYQNFGVTYSFDYKPVGDIKGLFDRSTEYQEEMAGSSTMAGPSSTLTGGQFKITTFNIKGFSATATIDALIRDDKAHLIASPSILTLNGKEARIIIGERYPYKEKTQTTTGTTETTKFVDIGTTLRVTPWVSSDGNITMYVHPEVSSLTAAMDAGPRIATREADATIMVRDGEAIIIGGLIKRQNDHAKGSIPIIGDIPLLGALFTNRSDDKTSTELVVVITPRIVKATRPQPNVSEHSTTVEIDTTGQEVLVTSLWKEAYNLENNFGVESVRKDEGGRMSEAMDRYKEIFTRYPKDKRADDALLHAASIKFRFYKDIDQASLYLEILMKNYPQSECIPEAKKLLVEIDKKRSSEKKKADKEQAKLDKQKLTEMKKAEKEQAKLDKQKLAEMKKAEKEKERLEQKQAAEAKEKQKKSATTEKKDQNFSANNKNS